MDNRHYLRAHLAASKYVIADMFHDEQFCQQVLTVADVIATAFKTGHKLLICGNGGSCADAQHIAAEFVGRYDAKLDRPPLPAIALTNPAVLTAIVNDMHADREFGRQVDALLSSGDVLLCLSTSGTSPNIFEAFERAAVWPRVLITGRSSYDVPGVECLTIPSTSTPIIQQGTMAVMHAVCGIVERTLFGPPAAG